MTVFGERLDVLAVLQPQELRGGEGEEGGEGDDEDCHHDADVDGTLSLVRNDL